MTVKAEPYDYELPAHKAALIMIDFQKDFMEPGGFGDALGNKIELLKVRLASQRAVCLSRIAVRVNFRAKISFVPCASCSSST